MYFEQAITKINWTHDDSHQHEVTLTLADFDIDLTKSISMTAVLHGLPLC